MHKLITSLSAGVLVVGLTVLVGCNATSPVQTGALAKVEPELALSPAPTVALDQHDHAEDDGVPRIEGPAAVKLVQAKEALIIDTRDPESYKNLRIKDALNIPYSDFQSGKYQSLPKDKQLIFYCT